MQPDGERDQMEHVSKEMMSCADSVAQCAAPEAATDIMQALSAQVDEPTLLPERPNASTGNALGLDVVSVDGVPGAGGNGTAPTSSLAHAIAMPKHAAESLAMAIVTFSLFVALAMFLLSAPGERTRALWAIAAGLGISTAWRIYHTLRRR